MVVLRCQSASKAEADWSRSPCLAKVEGMRGERFLGAAVVALWVAAACGDSDPPKSEDPPVDLDCDPGDTRPCEGVPECGTAAIQTCFPSGVGWSACTCYRGEGGAGAGGAGGEAGDSSAGEAGDSSAGGAHAGGSSTSGTSAGGTSAGGTSAGGTSAGGTSAGGSTNTSTGGTSALAGAAGQAGEGP